MNKKGFTLVELLVSLVLLTIAMTFMINFILKARNEKNKLEEDYNISLMVIQTEVSKYLNEDVIKNSGIKEILVNETYDKCSITYNNNLKRTLEIIDEKSIKYYDENKTYFLKTINGEETFGQIEYNFDNTKNKIQKIVIYASDVRYNIEVYSK